MSRPATLLLLSLLSSSMLAVATPARAQGDLDPPPSTPSDTSSSSSSSASSSGEGPDSSPAMERPEDAPAEDDSQLDKGIDLTLKEDRIKAVSRKTFLKLGRFELEPSVGLTTNDPFFRTYNLAGRVSYHVNDALAVEAGFAYAAFRENLPQLDLLREQGSLINVDAPLVGILDAGITFSPFYGKIAILSDQIIHFDGFAIAGIGTVIDQNGNVLAPGTAEFGDPLHPTMDIGAGLRVFLLRWLVVRADVRDYVYPQDRENISTLQNLLVVNLGVGFYFPLDFTYQYEAARVNG